MNDKTLKILIVAVAIMVIIAFFAGLQDAESAPVVGTPSNIYTSNANDGACLGIPRWKGYMNSDTVWVFPAEGDGNDPTGAYSVDGGVNWSTIDGSMDGLGSCDYHLSVWGATNGIAAVFPSNDNSDYLGYRYINKPATSSSDFETVQTLNAHSTFSSVVTQGDTTWITARSGLLDTIWFFVLVNQTLTDSTKIHINTSGVEKRVGSFIGFDNHPKFAVFTYSSSLVLYTWNGSDAVLYDTVLIDANLDATIGRGFTVNQDGSEYHWIYGSRVYGDHSELIDIHGTSAGWTTDTLSETTTFTDAGYAPLSCNYHDSLFLFYANSSGGASFVYRYYDGSSWIADSAVVTASDAVNGYIQTVPTVPADVYYIPLFWRNNTTGDIRFNKITMACDEPMADTLIYSLPFTVTTGMNNYDIYMTCDSTKMSAGGRWLTINANVHDVTLHLGQDSILWNTADSIMRYGVFTSGGCYNIIIDSGFVIEQPSFGADSSHQDSSDAIRFSTNDHDITIRNGYWSVVGRNSQIVRLNGYAYNILLYNNNFDNNVTAFYDRQQWGENAMIAFDYMERRGTGFNYNLRVSNCDGDAHWSMIYCQGDSYKVVIDSNNFNLDACNKYTGAGMLGSAEQCYVVGLTGTGAKNTVDIFDNTFTSGTTYSGGDGIFVTAQGIDTTAANCIEIYNNTINMDKGYAEEYDTSTKIKLRQTARNVVIHDNIINTTGDTASATNYRAALVDGIRLEELNNDPPNVIVENNQITVAYNGLFPAGQLAIAGSCIMMDGIDSSEAQSIWIRNNKLMAGNLCYLIGDGNGDPDYARNMTIIGDTLSYGADGDHYNVISFRQLGNQDNILRDPILLDSASYSDIEFIGATTADITTQITATLTVNSSGSPLSGATVQLWDSYGDTAVAGDTLWNRSTNGSGQVSGVLSMEFQKDGAGDSLHAAFDPWIVRVSKSGYTTVNQAISFEWNLKADTISLTASGAPPKRFWRIRL